MAFFYIDSEHRPITAIGINQSKDVFSLAIENPTFGSIIKRPIAIAGTIEIRITDGREATRTPGGAHYKGGAYHACFGNGLRKIKAPPGGALLRFSCSVGLTDMDVFPLKLRDVDGLSYGPSGSS